MRIPKLVAFKVAFMEKLKSVFRSSEGYLEPGRISTMNLLAVYFCRKASSEMLYWIVNTSSCRSFFNVIS